MLRRINTFLLGLFLVFGFTSYANNSDNLLKDWERLGSKKVNYKVDRDIIPVGLRDGRFNKLKVVVTRGKLNVHKMIVHYGNGTKDEITLRHNFGRRSASRTIDLEGRNRIIKKITFIYDTKNTSRQTAKIHVYGRK